MRRVRSTHHNEDVYDADENEIPCTLNSGQRALLLVEVVLRFIGYEKAQGDWGCEWPLVCGGNQSRRLPGHGA